MTSQKKPVLRPTQMKKYFFRYNTRSSKTITDIPLNSIDGLAQHFDRSFICRRKGGGGALNTSN